jgi:hypothetical protein
VGDLQQYTGTVAGFVVGAFRSPVFHPFQNLKAPFKDEVGRAAFNIRHKTYAAGIVFVFPSI